MWIEEVKKDDKVVAYKFVDRYYNIKQGKHRRVSVQMNTNSKQSENKARAILAKRIEDINSTSSATIYTLGEIFESYLEFKEKRWSYGTYENMLSTYRTHIEDSDITSYAIPQITLKDVQDVLDTVQYDKGLSHKLTKRVQFIILSAMHYAQIYHDNYNPTDFRSLQIKKDTPRKSKYYIESEDVPYVMNKIREIMTEFEADLLEVQLLTGMRFGEVSALTKADWTPETITINKSVNARKRRTFDTTKTYASYRVIDSSQKINEIVTRRIKYNDRIYRGESSLIFANTANRPPLLDPINKKLKLIDKNYTTHTMRHTHISMLAENNVPIKYVMNRVGHADNGTTMKIYTHVTNKMREDNRSIIDKLY